MDFLSFILDFLFPPHFRPFGGYPAPRHLRDCPGWRSDGVDSGPPAPAPPPADQG